MKSGRLHFFMMLPLVTVGYLLLAGCQLLLAPPRLATATAQAAATATATAAPVVLAAPTATPGSETADSLPPANPNPTLTVWVNESSAAHEAALASMAAQFRELYQIDVQMVQISPLLLPELVNTAVLSDTLPDIIIHPLAYSVGWAERGIFDSSLTADVVAELGPETFDPAALALVENSSGMGAIPTNGFQKILLYRQDWFNERGLAAPTSYDNMFAAAAAFFERETAFTSGFVISTEANLLSTQHGFEQIAAANGCQLVDEKGEIMLLEPDCQEALNFYYNIIHNFSPPGVQTDTSAVSAYLAGRTGMIMTSPTILPLLSGIGTTSSCAECVTTANYLQENSGILTEISGRGPNAVPANFGEISYLGITAVAPADVAARFASFWFNEGYETWLAVESERKVPMRWGTAVAPRQFIDRWGHTPLAGSDLSLADLYGDDLVRQLATNIAPSARWGFPQNQGVLMTTLYEKLTLPVVLQEMLSGYFNTEKTIIESYIRITELIPNYQFAVELEPTATPGSG